MNTQIFLGKVYVASINTNSGVFYGENKMVDWKSRSKNNASVGRVNGDGNYVGSRLNLIHDPDIFDMIVNTKE